MMLAPTGEGATCALRMDRTGEGNRVPVLTARRTSPFALGVFLVAWAALLGVVLAPEGSLVSQPVVASHR